MHFPAQNKPVLQRITVSDLRLGMYIHKLEGNWFLHPFWRDSFLLEREQDLKKIQDSPIHTLWIDLSKSSDPALPASPGMARSGDTTPAAAQAPALPASHEAPGQSAAVALHEEIEKARRICLDAREQIMDMFEEARMGRAIDPESTIPLVQQIAESVNRHPQALFSVARLKTKDTYTYLHSVAVCALMLALARQLRLAPDLTRQAGLGGLMHDLGKAGIPPEILNKPGRLTDQEFDVMRQHPQIGMDLLQKSGASAEVMGIALHHHEKINGTGYPGKLAGASIPLLARMGAVCDVYDAVTSTRIYKAAWNPAEALHQMASWAGHFDRPIFEAFVKTVGIYPIGSLVRLRSQRLAVVVDQEGDLLLTPKVIVFYDAKTKREIPPTVLKLSEPDCGEAILGQESSARWGFEHLDQYWMPAPG